MFLVIQLEHTTPSKHQRRPTATMRGQIQQQPECHAAIITSVITGWRWMTRHNTSDQSSSAAALASSSWQMSQICSRGYYHEIFIREVLLYVIIDKGTAITTHFFVLQLQHLSNSRCYWARCSQGQTWCNQDGKMATNVFIIKGHKFLLNSTTGN